MTSPDDTPTLLIKNADCVATMDAPRTEQHHAGVLIRGGENMTSPGQSGALLLGDHHFRSGQLLHSERQ